MSRFLIGKMRDGAAAVGVNALIAERDRLVRAGRVLAAGPRKEKMRRRAERLSVLIEERLAARS